MVGGLIVVLALIAFAFSTPGRYLIGGGLTIAGLVVAITLWKESVAASLAAFLVLGGLGGWIYPGDSEPSSPSTTGGSSSTSSPTYTFSDCVDDAIDMTFELWLAGHISGPWDEEGVRRGAEAGCADL